MKRKFRVKELAQKQDLTQEELLTRVRANGGNITLAGLQRIWQNHRLVGDPRTSTMIAIARSLGVTVEDLYTSGEESYTEEHERTPGHAALPLEAVHA